MDPQYQLRNQPPMPEFYQFDDMKKDEFLSQLGNYTQEQRTLFLKVTEFWEPELGYSRFISRYTKEFSFLENHLRGLMERLAKARCGLIRNSFKEGHLEPDQIILHEIDSIRFYYYSIENEYLAIFNRENRNFITPKYIAEEMQMNIPSEYIETIKPHKISSLFINENKPFVRLLKIQFTGYEIITTPVTFQALIRIARDKVRNYLMNNSDIINYVSKLLSTVISDVQKHMRHTDTVFWHKLTKAIVENKEEFLLKRKNIDKAFFPAVEILLQISASDLENAEKERKERTEKRDAMVDVCKRISEKSDPFLDQHHLNLEIEEYVKKWPDFKENFFDSCVKFKNKTSLPLIVNIEKGYIHRDHVYPSFKIEIDEARRELKEFYIDNMERMLWSNNRERVTVFSGRDNFIDDITERIAAKRPLLDALLNKPRIVSESIIYYCKNRLKYQDMEKMREVLNLYYEEGSTARYKSYDQLFELYLLRIFHDAYKNLSIWKRIFMKLFGRYESYIQIFSGKKGDARIMQPKTSKPSKKRTAIKRDTGLNENLPSDFRQRKTSNQDSARSARPRKKITKKTPYSSRQQNKAWEEFQQAFKDTD